ncbi:Gldg family protein [Desulfolithobacter sp.]
MRNIRIVFIKEFNSFFASPAAWLFLGSFLLVNLFLFFWAEAFFARNIADLQPLFKWMPVLLIFLVAALTMRSWSEERRAGTLESLLTSPVSPLHLVLGKFCAGLALVALALLLTLPLPATVSLLGPLDWGPVIGGYVASLFLAAAYIAIGLNMSGRTDNPIVALILTVAVAGFFYLLGTPTLTTLFGHSIGGLLKLIGTGSRFESITRGVLDLRDIYYYISIVGIFLSLNLLSLERFRWAGNPTRPRHRQWQILTGLTMLNFLLANFWLQPLGQIRLDLTEGRIYSLSATTKAYLRQLQEPLLIRGYFSARTHPLLEPLVPQIKDLLKEYQVAGGDRVRVEFIDPHTDQEAAEEAADKYGIRPVPFRMASRYQSGVVNSYFNLLIAYGDQFETLSFEDLIEVKVMDAGEPEVLLKNPEYAITRATRKVTTAYRAGGDVFAALTKPVTFHGYISPDEKLPQVLVDLRRQLNEVLDELAKDSGGKLKVEFADPDAGSGELARQLRQDYGFAPQVASLFDPNPFWFYMVLTSEGESVQVPLPEELNREALKKAIQTAARRMAPGYLKTVALVTPPESMPTNPYMPMQRSGKRYQLLRETLSENVRLIDTDLKEGRVPADTDLLLLMAPDALDEKQLFAVDQFLMQGGSVVVATSPFDVEMSTSLQARKHSSGLDEWLKHHGLSIAETMVLDPHNAALPVPVKRRLGPIVVNELQMLPYPHFPDIRRDGLDNGPITGSLGQLTMNWASPITVDKEGNARRQVTELAHSSPQSWTSADLDIIPDYNLYPDTGFKPGGKRGARLLAVAVRGAFDSFFKGKPSPLLQEENKDKTEKPAGSETDTEQDTDVDSETMVTTVLEHSSDSARLVLISSNTFGCDSVISLASQAQGTQYTRQMEFLQNSIDWALDDEGLTSIRSRTRLARMLVPMDQSTRLFWEYLNYGLALLGLLLVWLWRGALRRRRLAHYERVLAEV